MKSAKIKEMLKVALTTVAAVGLFGALLIGVNHQTLRAATAEEIYLPQTVAYVSTPENSIPAAQAVNMIITDVTVFTCEIMQGVDEVDPLALSAEEAAAIGAQYIYDIFGVSIDGMYVEVAYTHWPTISRKQWHGNVSRTYRNTLEQTAATRRRAAEFQTRYAAGESLESIDAYFEEEFQEMFASYEVAMFTFIIDAITGERIDIWYNSPDVQRPMWIVYDENCEEMQRMMENARIIREYVENTWNNDWELAFAAELNEDETTELYRMAWHYGQRQFNLTTVTEVEFLSAGYNIEVDNNGNIVRNPGSASLGITDETGRIAIMSVCLESFGITAIHSSRNDFRVEVDYRDMSMGFDDPPERVRLVEDAPQ